ncbi:hypothetical protein GOP47_0022257 [Adiantum capillus-veneris]|uniref:Thylakoid membrane protein slr0575 n=1 Tax=Adiantum capillus-veneris TaxID=13818 RepID=A0A9D4U998_ADICA|nr:hypothetical protein GOP47_0021815 [Adiantum capillus-veneris]KAI5063710.1 hypothetical protein GOP47_0022257 [Adiantum capillus-veneris]
MASSCVAGSSGSSPCRIVTHAAAHLRRPIAAACLAPKLERPSGLRSSFIETLTITARSSTRLLRLRLAICVRATSQLETSSSPVSKEVVPDTQFSIFKTSLGTIGLSAGLVLLSYGFGAYFTVLPGAEWSAIMLTYGFPLAVIGMALKYAELKPVPCTTYADALALQEAQATPTLKQVKSDVTRFRYGDEQHLDEALKRIFRYGQGGGIQRRNAPVLQAIREEVTTEGKYSLVLVFEAKALELKDFTERQAKFASFFGPGITADIAAGGENLYEVKLVVNGGQ